MIGPDGAPCNPPPWGTLTAVDLETGDVRWERPLGSVAQLAGVKGSEKWGSPNLGGAMTTAGGVVFAGGALDQRLHAYDAETGAELWSAVLPAGVHASPMTYVTASGRQYVVVAAGGHKELGDKAGDYVVAFALPRAGGTREPPPPAHPVSAGHYEGHIVLDRTRVRLGWDLGLRGAAATVALHTLGIRGGGARHGGGGGR